MPAVYKALQEINPMFRKLHYHARKMKDLKMGDSHLIPLITNDSNSTTNNEQKLKFKDIKKEELFKVSVALSFCINYKSKFFLF